ncbi:MAG: ATP-binding protein [Candidatus Methanomethylophilaceae archaeon]|nr:ATP-binding protein [Candidatus Methanomethylophilaceae archaeon]
MKRKAYDELLRWKEESKGTSAILIDGARRTGKSYLAEVFAKNEYRSHIMIDFSEAPPSVRETFEEDSMNLDLLFSKLSLIYGTRLYERESLIVFDEVQRFPRAREMIKHLVADGRYDYLETGSLISIHTNISNIVIPSEEEHLELHPMDFEEFLWALGNDSTIPLIKEFFENEIPLGDAAHKTVMNLFRQYMLVGGMPQAVKMYVQSRDFSKVDRVKRNILNLYREDISRFATGYETKVRDIFDSIPSQLSRKERRFKIGSLGKNARSRDYEDAFLWLSDGMITNDCFNSTDPTVGLSMYEGRATRKCYMADTGLLITHSISENGINGNELYMDILSRRLNINEGMFVENIVAQILRSGNRKLYFYSRSDTNERRNDIEIDFLIRRNGRICPLEVKSTKNTPHISLDKFIQKFGKTLGEPVILYTGDVVRKDGILCLPLYMAMFL